MDNSAENPWGERKTGDSRVRAKKAGLFFGPESALATRLIRSNVEARRLIECVMIMEKIEKVVCRC